MPAEMSAAIVTGLVTILTVVVTTTLNFRFFRQNLKAPLRDRLYEKKLEAYQSLNVKVKFIMSNLTYTGLSPEKIIAYEKLLDDFEDELDKHSIYLPTTAYTQMLQFLRTGRNVRNAYVHGAEFSVELLFSAGYQIENLCREEIGTGPLSDDIRTLLEQAKTKDER